MKLKDFKQIINDSNKVNIDNRLNKIEVTSYLKQETPRRKLNLKLVYTFASILILFIIGFSINFVNTPISTLTFDLNPSIEVKINALNRVLSVEGINQDGNDFIQKLNYKNKSIDDLLIEIQEVGIREGYFDTTEGFLLVGVYSKDYEEEAKIIDILSKNTYFNMLTISQHLESEQLRLSETQTESFIESIWSKGAEADSSIDYNNGLNDTTDLPTASIDYSGYSEVKLMVVQTLINKDVYSQEELLTLLELPIEQLIEDYNNIN